MKPMLSWSYLLYLVAQKSSMNAKSKILPQPPIIRRRQTALQQGLGASRQAPQLNTRIRRFRRCLIEVKKELASSNECYFVYLSLFALIITWIVLRFFVYAFITLWNFFLFKKNDALCRLAVISIPLTYVFLSNHSKYLTAFFNPVYVQKRSSLCIL